jgi:2-dehydro-3-deoxyphosphooctonate aldolase (KDO 8-P synthase)
MKTFFKVDGLEITDDKLFLIAGPCVIEDEGLTREIAAEVSASPPKPASFIFKASFDKTTAPPGLGPRPRLVRAYHLLRVKEEISVSPLRHPRPGNRPGRSSPSSDPAPQA